MKTTTVEVWGVTFTVGYDYQAAEPGVSYPEQVEIGRVTRQDGVDINNHLSQECIDRMENILLERARNGELGKNPNERGL